MTDKVSYTIKWTQQYPEWNQMIDTYMDIMLEASEYKEANELIDKIKGK